MEDMEQKLNSILGDPKMMAQIMSMAQALGQSSPQPQESPGKSEPPPAQASGLGGLDMEAVQRIASIAQQSGIDRNQQSLLRALNPYLSAERLRKLERAMRAAKIAGLAGSFLGGSGGLFHSGR